VTTEPKGDSLAEPVGLDADPTWAPAAPPVAVVDDVHGLTTSQVAERRERGLVNVVTDDTRRTFADIVRANTLTRFNAILGTLLIVVLATGEYRDALFGIVLVANALIGIIQETRAKLTLDRLSVVSAPRVRVVRDGQSVDVATEDVVVDDLIEVSTGAKIPVDGGVLASSRLAMAP
jgi:cation-transporting ATPase E